MRHSSRFCPRGKGSVGALRETVRLLLQQGQTGRSVSEVPSEDGWDGVQRSMLGGWTGHAVFEITSALQIFGLFVDLLRG